MFVVWRLLSCVSGFPCWLLVLHDVCVLVMVASVGFHAGCVFV